ncbi:MAG: NrfD/PsrC family molybdoenzyme membrane anchor subunit, partial [Acidimicrobiales bacterium]
MGAPAASADSYYGRPIIKAPVWKHDITAYLFTGGLAAGSSMLAAGADLSGRAALRRGSRLTALAALSASAAFLIRDLGRPSRFANMLRVCKPTSPMSMGTWILTAYGPLAGLAAASELAGALPPGRPRALLRPAGRAAGLGAAALAPALATYTAVLLTDTAVPAWHEAHRHLPFVFAGSALASGAGAGLLAAPSAQAAPARRLAVAGAAVELAATALLEHGVGLPSGAYRAPAPARLLRLARVL